MSHEYRWKFADILTDLGIPPRSPMVNMSSSELSSFLDKHADVVWSVVDVTEHRDKHRVHHVMIPGHSFFVSVIDQAGVA